MLILLIILAIVSFLIYDDGTYKENEALEIIAGMVTFVLVAAIVVMLSFVLFTYGEGFTANDKINMYQEENKKIEKDVNILVEKYSNYENNTFSDLKTTSPTTLVSLFPELKTNELVKKQIDIYVENNNKIKELKEIKIDMRLARWLLYFGK